MLTTTSATAYKITAPTPIRKPEPLPTDADAYAYAYTHTSTSSKESTAPSTATILPRTAVSICIPSEPIAIVSTKQKPLPLSLSSEKIKDIKNKIEREILNILIKTKDAEKEIETEEDLSKKFIDIITTIIKEAELETGSLLPGISAFKEWISPSTEGLHPNPTEAKSTKAIEIGITFSKITNPIRFIIQVGNEVLNNIKQRKIEKENIMHGKTVKTGRPVSEGKFGIIKEVSLIKFEDESKEDSTLDLYIAKKTLPKTSDPDTLKALVKNLQKVIQALREVEIHKTVQIIPGVWKIEDSQLYAGKKREFMSLLKRAKCDGFDYAIETANTINGKLEYLKKLSLPIQSIAILHSRGFVHNDFKIENLLFDGTNLFLTDFGLSYPISELNTLEFLGFTNPLAQIWGGTNRHPEVDTLQTILFIKKTKEESIEKLVKNVDIWNIGITLSLILLGNRSTEFKEALIRYKNKLTINFKKLNQKIRNLNIDIEFSTLKETIEKTAENQEKAKKEIKEKIIEINKIKKLYKYASIAQACLSDDQEKTPSAEAIFIKMKEIEAM